MPFIKRKLGELAFSIYLLLRRKLHASFGANKSSISHYLYLLYVCSVQRCQTLKRVNQRTKSAVIYYINSGDPREFFAWLTVDVVIGLVVSVASLTVSRRLGIFHGQGMIQTVLEGFVLRVIRRRCLRSTVARHQARSNSEKLQKNFKLAQNHLLFLQHRHFRHCHHKRVPLLAWLYNCSLCTFFPPGYIEYRPEIRPLPVGNYRRPMRHKCTLCIIYTSMSKLLFVAVAPSSHRSGYLLIHASRSHRLIIWQRRPLIFIEICMY